MMTTIEVHKVPRGRLPISTLAKAILQLYPSGKKDSTTIKSTQEDVMPRDNEEVVILGIQDGTVAAAAIGVVSLEAPAMRLSLLRGRNADAVQGVVGALVAESQRYEHINTLFADAAVIVCKEELLARAGFRQATNPHYPMPAGMSMAV